MIENKAKNGKEKVIDAFKNLLKGAYFHNTKIAPKQNNQLIIKSEYGYAIFNFAKGIRIKYQRNKCPSTFDSENNWRGFAL